MDIADPDDGWRPARRAYLEQTGSEAYVELAEGDDRLHVRRGTVGRPALELRTAFVTPGRSASTFDEALRTVQAWGYAACTPRAPVRVGCVAHQLASTAIVDHPDHAEIFELGPAAAWRAGAPRRLLHFRNGLTVDGDLDLELLADLGLAAGAIIDGPVRVTGVLSQTGLDALGALLVRGDVRAASFIHRDGHIRITGDLRATHAIWGQYNDGCLEVRGTAVAEAWIGADTHDMRAARVVARATEPGHLRPDLLDAEGQLDSAALAACLAAGRSPVRPDRPAPAPAPPPPAAVAAADGAPCERYADADPGVRHLVDLMARPSLKPRLLAALDTQAPPPAVMRRHSPLLLFHALMRNRDHPDRYLDVIERLLERGVDPTLPDSTGDDALQQPLVRDQPAVARLLARRGPHRRPA